MISPIHWNSKSVVSREPSSTSPECDLQLIVGLVGLTRNEFILTNLIGKPNMLYDIFTPQFLMIISKSTGYIKR